jgi:hypothetical protein
MVTGLVLNSLENLTLSVSPPMDTLTTCLNELLVRPGSGGMLCGSTNCGAVAQVPTHFFSVSLLEVAKSPHELSSKNVMVNENSQPYFNMAVSCCG